MNFTALIAGPAAELSDVALAMISEMVNQDGLSVIPYAGDLRNSLPGTLLAYLCNGKSRSQLVSCRVTSDMGVQTSTNSTPHVDLRRKCLSKC